MVVNYIEIFMNFTLLSYIIIFYLKTYVFFCFFWGGKNDTRFIKDKSSGSTYYLSSKSQTIQVVHVIDYQPNKFETIEAMQVI